MPRKRKYVVRSSFWNSVFEEIGKNESAQAELARKSGVSASTINNGIAIKANPTLSNSYKIAKALNKSIEELHDPKEGKEYISKLVKNDPKNINVPDYMQDIVDNLELLQNRPEDLSHIFNLSESFTRLYKEKKQDAG